MRATKSTALACRAGYQTVSCEYYAVERGINLPWLTLNPIFSAGLTEVDIATVPRINRLTVDTQNPDFNCTRLEPLQRGGKIGELTCEDDFQTPFYGGKGEDSSGLKAKPSFAALAIALGCATYLSL